MMQVAKYPPLNPCLLGEKSMAGSSRVAGKSLADFPDILAQWHPTKNDETIVDRNKRSPNYGRIIGPEEIPAGSNKRYWWKCSEGPDHEWITAIDGRTTRGTGCPFCARKKVSVTNSLANNFPNIAAEWHPTKNRENTPEQVISGSHKKYWWKCDKGPDHEWEATLGHRVGNSSGCPFCAGKKVSVMASGDPLCYGIGAKLLKHIPISEVCIKPSLSTFSLICSRIGWSLPDVETLTIHGRPLEMIHSFVQCGAKLLVLSKDEDSPKNVAKLLLSRGFGKSIITVFENLGGKILKPHEVRKKLNLKKRAPN